MHIPIYHINAFTNRLFSGNPAAVCLLPHWPKEEILAAMAKENNLGVTAFLVLEEQGYAIRWLTPEYELDICGHGSLAAAFVIFHFFEPGKQITTLRAKLETIEILRNDTFITLNFPAKNLEPCSSNMLLEQGLKSVGKHIFEHGNDRLLIVFETEEEIRQLKPDMEILKKLDHRGIIVTAVGTEVDFVSRTFYPHKMLTEDPVTGVSHCLLAPYWAQRLGKTKLHAKQVSARGGELFCQCEGARVLISGQAVLYTQGQIVTQGLI